MTFSRKGTTMKSLLILALLGAAVAVPSPGRNQRIFGGSEVTIDHYPSVAPLLFGLGDFYTKWCASTILNTRSILTAGHCFLWAANPNHYRIRVGSTFANSGGTVHASSQIFLHPSFDVGSVYNDVAIIRLATVISFNTYTQPAAIAGPNYNLASSQVIWAAGWGDTEYHGGQPSEHLRHVQAFVINQALCRDRYAELGDTITDNMLCSTVLDVGMHVCLGDRGGPVYHNNVVVGVYSWGIECDLPRYPSVSTRVSSFSTWIQANA